LIGKPRSGRSTFAIELAKKLDIEYIDVLRPQLRIFDKVRENEENP
jgi:adenylate/nucleoside-diphosphate kinase